MTELALTERFRVARRAAVIVDDERVRAEIALPVPAGSRLRIRRRFTESTRPQGLRLSAPIDLVVGDVRATDLTLWSTTAPEVVEVQVDAVEACTIHLWNTWGTDGIAHAWPGNAGVLVETDLTVEPPAVVLWCSDGLGGVRFDDLVVAIEILVPADLEPADEQAPAEASATV